MNSMPNPYIKLSSRGSIEEVASIVNLLPLYTDHLNKINSSLTFIRRLKTFGTKTGNEAIVKAMADIEKQGSFNEFLALCLLDLLVAYKNALSAIHIWDELYSLRQGYLLIHESLRTYNSHSNALKELASKASSSAEVEFISLTKELKKFRKDSIISEIRNYTIGHIETDPVSFFSKMSKFNTDQAFVTLKAFLTILIGMLNLSDYIFINYTKNKIAKASFTYPILEKFSLEIDKLLEALVIHKN